MKTVNKAAKALLLAAVLFIALLLPGTKAQAAPTDEILNFTITVDVNDDASLLMTYHIEWKVLYDVPEAAERHLVRRRRASDRPGSHG